MASDALRIERQTRDALTCWKIGLGDAELLVAEQGAQLLSYGRRGEKPLIWLSEEAAFQAGQSLRGGVPLCWPWFGDLSRNPAAVRDLHPDPAQAPFHGLVRNLPWQLEEIRSEDGAATLEFLTRPAEGLEGWPPGLLPRLSLRLDGRLSLTLSSHNAGSRSLALSQALHSYLPVGDIARASIPALDGCRYLDTLDDWAERRQQGPVTFTGETDRIYLDTPALLELHDHAWGRRICLEARGSRSAIVWNPWIDKARRLSQFADDAWQGMLCIETANVMDDAVELAPGETAAIGFSLWSEPL
ncbi:D-hexose-6-phosphate mutarotase [Stutzerimonas tarimensis]|uniref:Putative glucose-6-phosphate 1-epimerase n=1 Tax=Stutzerimonas tarimensis TaxID=1507735 RepID=A0ABV7T4A4_9GAMM